MPETVDILLERWRQGDAEAGEQFIGQVYSELRRLAAYYFSGERSGHTLQPTAIVNELYLKMFSETPVEWKDRAHFFSVASRQRGTTFTAPRFQRSSPTSSYPPPFT